MVKKLKQMADKKAASPAGLFDSALAGTVGYALLHDAAPAADSHALYRCLPAQRRAPCRALAAPVDHAKGHA